jgi:hypothetical protein
MEKEDETFAFSFSTFASILLILSSSLIVSLGALSAFSELLFSERLLYRPSLSIRFFS